MANKQVEELVLVVVVLWEVCW